MNQRRDRDCVLLNSCLTVRCACSVAAINFVTATTVNSNFCVIYITCIFDIFKNVFA